MNMLKTLFLAALVAATPASGATAQAPANEATAAPAATDTVTPAANPAPNAAVSNETPVAVPAPNYPAMKPVAGVGQPVDGGIDFQPQVTENGEYAYWMANSLLLPSMAAVSLLVLGLLLWVIVRYRAKANPVPSKTTHNTFIEVVWTLLPVLILVAIAVPSLRLLGNQYKPAPRDAVVIKVTGYQWYWGYEYPDHGVSEIISKMLDEKTAAARGEPHQLAVDNRMVVPVGKTVKLLVTGADVIHSFAVPALWTKMDAVPGRLNETTFTITKPGVYYGQCSELCGVDHGYMPIAVEALPEAQFNAWVAAQGGSLPGRRTSAAMPVPAETAPSGEAAPVAVGDDNANNSGTPTRPTAAEGRPAAPAPAR